MWEYHQFQALIHQIGAGRLPRLAPRDYDLQRALAFKRLAAEGGPAAVGQAQGEVLRVGRLDEQAGRAGLDAVGVDFVRAGVEQDVMRFTFPNDLDPFFALPVLDGRARFVRLVREEHEEKPLALAALDAAEHLFLAEAFAEPGLVSTGDDRLALVVDEDVFIEFHLRRHGDVKIGVNAELAPIAGTAPARSTSSANHQPLKLGVCRSKSPRSSRTTR